MEAHDTIEDAVIGSAHEVPDRVVHRAILIALREGAVRFKVVRPRELRTTHIAKVLLGLLDEGSFDPELGYSDADRDTVQSLAHSAATIIG